MQFKTTYTLLIALILMASCSRPANQDKEEQMAEMHRGNGFKMADQHITVDLLLPTTPVKDQGKTELCWIYALLATIETEQLAKGDSVNLSPLWLERKAFEEYAGRSYLTGERISLRGTLMEAMRLYSTYGIVPYDSYHSIEGGTVDDGTANTHVLARRVMKMSNVFKEQKKGLSALSAAIGDMLDDELGVAPLSVYMLGAQYTMKQFAVSCCLPSAWQAYTSFTHHPFGESFAVEIPDNRSHLPAMNVPIGVLTDTVLQSLLHHHPVAWEGKMGVYDNSAYTDKDGKPLYYNDDPVNNDFLKEVQRRRQKAFESDRLTDDHCMAIVGMAHDTEGEKYFIMKNSWGVHDGRNGFRLMSFDEFRMNTIIVMAYKDI